MEITRTHLVLILVFLVGSLLLLSELKKPESGTAKVVEVENGIGDIAYQVFVYKDEGLFSFNSSWEAQGEVYSNVDLAVEKADSINSFVFKPVRVVDKTK